MTVQKHKVTITLAI